MAPIKCKVCDVGSLERKQVRRMGPIVVVIGYILLLPSVFGMLLSAMMFFGVGRIANDPLGAGVGTFIGLMFFVFSLVGGLLGWLLVMRKTVLQCGNCSATIAAA